jgi:putative ABC transport system permease protein
MTLWLQDFAYRINFGWWMFGAAGLLALLTAFLTTSYHAFKAARTNPMKNLRTE